MIIKDYLIGIEIHCVSLPGNWETRSRHWSFLPASNESTRNGYQLFRLDPYWPYPALTTLVSSKIRQSKISRAGDREKILVREISRAVRIRAGETIDQQRTAHQNGEPDPGGQNLDRRTNHTEDTTQTIKNNNRRARPPRVAPLRCASQWIDRDRDRTVDCRQIPGTKEDYPLADPSSVARLFMYLNIIINWNINSLDAVRFGARISEGKHIASPRSLTHRSVHYVLTYFNVPGGWCCALHKFDLGLDRERRDQLAPGAEVLCGTPPRFVASFLFSGFFFLLFKVYHLESNKFGIAPINWSIESWASLIDDRSYFLQ